MAERLSAAAGWDLAKAILGLQRERAVPTTGTATFVRRDLDGTCWVSLPGSDAETPVNGDVVASANPGDVVRYETGGGSLTITGNATDPAVGGSVASQIATSIVRPVIAVAATARGIAAAAQKVANAVNQHFWTDTSGVHVTQATQEEWESQHSGPNVLINSVGQLFRDGLNNLLTITTESGARALTIWDGLGNEAANVLASFSADLVELGRNSASAVISFCNGTGYLRYDVNNGFMLSTEDGTGGSTPSAGVGVSANTTDARASMGASATSSSSNTSRIECRSGSNGKYIRMDAPALMLADNGLTSTGTRVSMRRVIELFTEDIDWTSLPLSTQAKAWTAATAPRYCRHLGIVQLTGEASPKSEVAASGTLTIGTLPVDCRPPRRINVLCQGSGVREWLLTVEPDGTVQVARYRLGNAPVEMPTDSWLPFHVVFVPASTY